MALSNESNLACIRANRGTGGWLVLVITLVDFAVKEVKRALVSEENVSTADAARNAGNDRLKGMSNDC